MTVSFPASRTRGVLKKLAALYADMDAAYAAADLTVATCGVTPAATVEHLLQGIKL